LFSDTSYQEIDYQKIFSPHQQYQVWQGTKKTLLIRQKSFEYVVSILSSWDLTYLSRFSSGWSWHLTFRLRRKLNAGCQGFFGPFPSAFLDKRCCKNCCKDNVPFSIFPNPPPFFYKSPAPFPLHPLPQTPQHSPPQPPQHSPPQPPQHSPPRPPPVIKLALTITPSD
jgi:hypothetical protein